MLPDLIRAGYLTTISVVVVTEREAADQKMDKRH